MIMRHRLRLRQHRPELPRMRRVRSRWSERLAAATASLVLTIHSAWFAAAVPTRLIRDDPPSLPNADAKGQSAKTDRRPAAGTGAAKRPTNPATGARNPGLFTPEREAAGLAFAKRHHPELLALLGPLAAMNRAAYEDAILELFTVSERLAAWQTRDPARHAIMLELWIVQSKIDLLRAKLLQSPSPDQAEPLRRELRVLLDRQIEAELNRQRLDRAQVEARLRKLEEGIARLERDRAKLVENRLKRLMSLGEAAQRARPPENGPPPKRAAEATPSPSSPPTNRLPQPDQPPTPPTDGQRHAQIDVIKDRQN